MMKRMTAILSILVLLCGLCGGASASQSQAKHLGSAMIGMTMVVTQKVHVRAAADDHSGLVASIEPYDAYTVLGYTRSTKNGNYWYLIRWNDADNGWYGWVSATMADLLEDVKLSVSGRGYCIINYPKTCKARSGPGQEYSQVAICIKGNGFVVRDIRRGSNGKNWYNISVDGISCWISSGLADYYPY